jgi:hypothetical protein
MKPSRLHFAPVAAVAFLAAASVALGAAGDISTVAGTGVAAFAAADGVALSATLNEPSGVGATDDGGYLIADMKNHVVRRVSPSGSMTLVAGTGVQGYDGDGVPATTARLFHPTSAEPTADGGILIADSGNQRIRKVAADGMITTVAGDGTSGFSGDGGQAAAAQLRDPSSAVPTPDGGFLVADTLNDRIRKVSAAGTISTVAGTGAPGYSGDDGSATSASLKGPTDVAITRDGGFLIVDSSNDRVRKVSAVGVITTVAGDGTSAYAGDDGPATSASLARPNGVVEAGDGTIFIADGANQRVRRVTTSGTISTVAGTGTQGSAGDGGPASAAEFDNPADVSVTPAGSLLVADRKNHRIRLVEDVVAPTPTATPTPTPTPDVAPSPPVIPSPEPEVQPEPVQAAAGPGTPTVIIEEPAIGNPAEQAPALEAPQVRPPIRGVAAVVAPEHGVIRVRVPGSARFTVLDAARNLPIGTIFDASDGALSLTTALPGGKRQTGSFSSGKFTVRQGRTGDGKTRILLRGGDFSRCRTAPAVKLASAAAKRRTGPVRRLWGQDKGGRYSTQGRDSVATVRGTRWLTEDRCDGTLTRVTQGAVDVRDRHRGTTRRVKAGRSVLVKRR